VPDLESAIAFYTRAFDLQVGRRMGADFVELIGCQAPIYLLVNAAGTSALKGTGTVTDRAVQRSYARHWTAVHLDFVVTDIHAALERALEAGATQEGVISEHPYGALVLLADPYGHGVCLVEFNERGYDAIAT